MSWVAILVALTVGGVTASIKAGYDRHTARSSKYNPHRFTQITFVSTLTIACFGWLAYKAYYTLFPVYIEDHPHALIWFVIPIVVAAMWAIGYVMDRVLAGSLEPPTSFDFVMDTFDENEPIIMSCELKSQTDDWHDEKIVLGVVEYASHAPHKRDVYLWPVLYEGTKGGFIYEMELGRQLLIDDEDSPLGILIDFDSVVMAMTYKEKE